MEFEISGETHHPDPGEELHIPKGAVHSVHNIGHTTARYTAFVFGHKHCLAKKKSEK